MSDKEKLTQEFRTRVYKYISRQFRVFLSCLFRVSSRREDGFTLIELLIVIAIIIILVGGLIVTVNPIHRMADARDDTRESHIHQIMEAANRRNLELGGRWECGLAGPLPFRLDGHNIPIFQFIGTGPGNYNLFACLVPDYLAQVLLDPRMGSLENSGYQIWQHPVTRRISVRAHHAETRAIWVGDEPGRALAVVPVDFLHGWAWSENVGWISMNVFTGGGEVSYGVGMAADGILSGSAWSRGTGLDVGGFGWLRFDVTPFTGEFFPRTPLHSARFDPATNRITGWARFCSGTVNNDCASASRTDFNGWVLLGPIIVDGIDRGVRVDTAVYPHRLYGWAFGSEPIGWISFNCNNPELPWPRCTVSDYRVLMEKTHP